MQDRSIVGDSPDSGGPSLSIRAVPPQDELEAVHHRTFRARRRNRHGRGLRGEILPSVLPASRTRAERFEDWVFEAADRLQDLNGSKLDGVEYAVEEIPPGLEQMLRDGGRPPQGHYTPGAAGRAPRITVYRRVVETGAGSPAEIQDLVHDIVVEYTALMLGVAPETLDPYYRGY
ncbi:metallopeptidase family protein [Sinomonas sp. P10A9]|uniref:Metallopeptidase family protein n=1 Tax=Sinomonas puerhi TaxID=3238584 RepID=A0AB39L978_9MICC